MVEKGTPILYEHGLLYLCLECRLGKTLTALSIAEKIGARKVFFVTKKKVITSVLADYRKVKEDNPYLFDITVVNPEAIVAAFRKAEKMAFLVTGQNYPKLSKKGVRFKQLFNEECARQRELLAPYLAPKDIDLVVIDEAHSYGANPKPALAQQCLRILFHDKRIIYLSGTPSPESYSQLYHQFQMSDRTPFKDYPTFYKWAHKFVDIEEVNINGLRHQDYSNARIEDIKPFVEPLMISMTQEEAGFTTEIDEHIVRVEMSRETAELIRKVKRHKVAEVDGRAIVADTPAKMLQKVHQLGSGTIKFEDDTHLVTDRTKAKAVKGMFEGKHIAVTYVYQAELDLLKEAFDGRWTTSPEEFQADRRLVFLGQVKSIREGIRLDTADAFVFYNIEWSYTSYAQARQRIVSKEREGSAPIYFIFSDCGIEGKVYEALGEKESFSTSWYLKNKD